MVLLYGIFSGIRNQGKGHNIEYDDEQVERTRIIHNIVWNEIYIFSRKRAVLLRRTVGIYSTQNAQEGVVVRYFI